MMKSYILSGQHFVLTCKPVVLQSDIHIHIFVKAIQSRQQHDSLKEEFVFSFQIFKSGQML